jgi:hypothetical protein
MTRATWSVPSRPELWHVLIGIIVGLSAAGLLAFAGNGKALLIVIVTFAAILWGGLFVTNMFSWAHEDKQRHQHLREQEANLKRERDTERFWRLHANRAATNKHTGLQWTGHRIRKPIREKRCDQRRIKSTSRPLDTARSQG